MAVGCRNSMEVASRADGRDCQAVCATLRRARLDAVPEVEVRFRFSRPTLDARSNAEAPDFIGSSGVSKTGLANVFDISIDRNRHAWMEPAALDEVEAAKHATGLV